MRYLPVLLILTGALIALNGQATSVSAKSGITISPDLGPAGTIIDVQGFGFRPHEQVRISLVQARTLSTSSYHEWGLTVPNEAKLPATLHLATVTPNKNYNFSTTVTLPPFDEIQKETGATPNALEIIATVTNRDGNIFVARSYFTMEGADISSGAGSFHAAVGAAATSSDLPAWPFLVSLGMAGAALLLVVSNMIRTRI